MMNEGLKTRLHIRCMEAMRHFFFTADEDTASERRTAFLPLQVLYDLLGHLFRRKDAALSVTKRACLIVILPKTMDSTFSRHLDKAE